MIKILNKGHSVTVSPEDVHLLDKSWYVHDGYARWQYRKAGEPRAWVHMSRIVLERKLLRPLRSSEYADHINGNRLDNRRENLRIASASGNAMNTASRSNSSSKYTGVTWREKSGLWMAKVRKHRKDYHVGYFNCDIEAAKARDLKARELHGSFARFNFPDEVSR